MAISTGAADVDQLHEEFMEAGMWMQQQEHNGLIISSNLSTLYGRAHKRIIELEAALGRAACRFELLASVSDDMVNGARPSVGAAECNEALKGSVV